MLAELVMSAVLALGGHSHGAEAGRTYQICEGWETSSTSVECADPSGFGVTVNGVRYQNCEFDDTVLCFDVVPPGVEGWPAYNFR